MSCKVIRNAIAQLTKVAKEQKEEQEVLRQLDCFVLDNSLRESTVSQVRGHTIEDKWKIFREVKKCGFQHIVVAAFSDVDRVDDVFVKQIVESGEDMTKLFGFVDFTADIINGAIDMESIPANLLKMKELKLRNPIIEIDLADQRIDWAKKCGIKEVCQLLQKRIEWIKREMCSKSKILINLRDLVLAITICPDRVLEVVKFLGSLEELKRPIGLMFEEPTGNFLHDEMSSWTQAVRKVMDAAGWKNGHLLVHVHHNWGLAETVQLECLKAGADGIWASVCEEGAPVGHACSTITLMNLIRLGNKKVLEKYNCTYLRTAAIEVTKITTGVAPHLRQCLYGARALDYVFDVGAVEGDLPQNRFFDIAYFFGVDQPIRISTLSTHDMMLQHLKKTFGYNPDFTHEMVVLMKKKMVEDLLDNRKEEYMSPVGLALLFDRSGGHLNKKMRDVINKWEVNTPQWKLLSSQLRVIWEALLSESNEADQEDDAVGFETFFKRFLAPYYRSLDCEDARRSLKALDMDKDGKVEWLEFMVYVKWAIEEYPNISNVDELLSVTFKQGLFSAMIDETGSPLA